LFDQPEKQVQRACQIEIQQQVLYRKRLTNICYSLNLWLEDFSSWSNRKYNRIMPGEKRKHDGDQNTGNQINAVQYKEAFVPEKRDVNQEEASQPDG